jgi:hypothetical protein
MVLDPSVTVTYDDGATLYISCDDGPTVRVLETSSSVVLSASATGSKDASARVNCAARRCR